METSFQLNAERQMKKLTQTLYIYLEAMSREMKTSKGVETKDARRLWIEVKEMKLM